MNHELQKRERAEVLAAFVRESNLTTRELARTICIQRGLKHKSAINREGERVPAAGFVENTDNSAADEIWKHVNLDWSKVVPVVDGEEVVKARNAALNAKAEVAVLLAVNHPNISLVPVYDENWRLVTAGRLETPEEVIEMAKMAAKAYERYFTVFAGFKSTQAWYCNILDENVVYVKAEDKVIPR